MKLGMLFLKHRHDTLRALHWLNKSALQGSFEAENTMYDLYKSNYSKHKSRGEVVKDSMLHSLHQARGRESQVVIAPEGTPKDNSLPELYRVLWLLKAQDNIKANKNLLDWAMTTAQQMGNASALYHLSKIYRQNDDTLQANELLKKSALKGLAVAQNDWAILLKDTRKQKEFLELSAQQGLMTAKYNLALVQIKEEQIIPAIELLEECIRQNMTMPKLHLGLLYFFGMGVGQDKGKAMHLMKESYSKYPTYIKERLSRNLVLLEK
jgi:TPR repeat protein